MTSVDVYVFARAALGIVMVAAGAAKYATGLDEFQAALADYRLLPHALVRPLSRALPAAEVTLGLLLVGGAWVGPAGLVCAALLLSFATGIAVNLARGRRDISCGCFGSRAHKISLSLAVRNAALALVAVYVAAPVGAGWDPRPSAEVGLSETIPATLVALGVALLCLVLLSLRDVWRSGGLAGQRMLAGPHGTSQEGDGI